MHPVCNWILNPQRGYPKKTALLYAIGFLVAVASAELYFEYFQTKAANYYSVLGATRSDSTKSTIKKSYREVRFPSSAALVCALSSVVVC